MDVTPSAFEGLFDTRRQHRTRRLSITAKGLLRSWQGRNLYKREGRFEMSTARQGLEAGRAKQVTEDALSNLAE